MYTVPCPECVQVTAIEWKRLGAWDGWLGLGMTNTQNKEKPSRHNRSIDEIKQEIIFTKVNGGSVCSVHVRVSRSHPINNSSDAC